MPGPGKGLLDILGYKCSFMTLNLSWEVFSPLSSFEANFQQYSESLGKLSRPEGLSIWA